MQVKVLTVSYHKGFGGYLPAIHITGKMVLNNGFNPGDQIVVKFEDKKILITKMDDELLKKYEKVLTDVPLIPN